MNENNITTFSVDVEIKKDIPEKQIRQFEDRSVYFTAVLTREITKGANAYPRGKTKELSKQEIRTPIAKQGYASYGLLRGTTYASFVYKMDDVKWTNTKTIPHWYGSIYRAKEKTIIETAQKRALKEIKGD